AQRLDEVDHRQDVADAEDGGAGRGHDVQDLEFVRVGVVAARHAQVPEDELGEEGQVKADENDQRPQFGPAFRVHAPAHFRPPVMNPAEVGNHRAAHHEVVEMGDDEVGVGDVDIDP